MTSRYVPDLDPVVRWREPAQLLEVFSLRFAERLTDSAAAFLHVSEAAQCRENNLSAIVITTTVED